MPDLTLPTTFLFQEYHITPRKQAPATPRRVGKGPGICLSTRFSRAHLTERASSPALSDIPDLSILSRSPRPVPGYQHPSDQTDEVLPLTPLSTPGRLRASNGRFTSRNAKKATTPDKFRYVLVTSLTNLLRTSLYPLKEAAPTRALEPGQPDITTNPTHVEKPKEVLQGCCPLNATTCPASRDPVGCRNG